MNTLTGKFPEKGKSLAEMSDYVLEKKKQDMNWKNGKAFCLVYHPEDKYSAKIKAIFDLYFHDNALNPTATKSLTDLEMETIGMCCELFHGDEKTRGNITSGGTESILLAIKTARDYAQHHKPHIKTPNAVVCETVHPAFMKAFHYFGLDFKTTPTDQEGKAIPSEMEKAIDHNTIILVASAPSYPNGIIDPIDEIGKLAIKHQLLFHVDACIGGFILPFLKMNGEEIPAFDFQVPGVSSLSADVHKYGYSSKGSSVVLYKDSSIRKHQFAVYTKWKGGVYGSPTIMGTRPGGTIAGAWAALNGIGMDGYKKMAKTTLEVSRKIQEGINAIEELEVIGEPKATLFAFTSSKLDIYQLADELNGCGWFFDRQQNPASIHLTINHIHKDTWQDFLADLKKCVEKVNRFSLKKLKTKIKISAVKGLNKILPSGSIAKFQNKHSKADDIGTGKNTAAMYGMMGALKGTNDLDEIVSDFLDKLYTPK